MFLMVFELWEVFNAIWKFWWGFNESCSISWQVVEFQRKWLNFKKKWRDLKKKVLGSYNLNLYSQLLTVNAYLQKSQACSILMHLCKPDQVIRVIRWIHNCSLGFKTIIPSKALGELGLNNKLWNPPLSVMVGQWSIWKLWRKRRCKNPSKFCSTFVGDI